MPGTDLPRCTAVGGDGAGVASYPIVLRVHYTLSGTDAGYAPTPRNQAQETAFLGSGLGLIRVRGRVFRSMLEVYL
eukprot:3251850-Rhodomonas_salina.1